MAYCRFRNTLQDLRACEENIYEELLPEEHKARARLIELCKMIASEFEDDEDIENLPELFKW